MHLIPTKKVDKSPDAAILYCKMIGKNLKDAILQIWQLTTKNIATVGPQLLNHEPARNKIIKLC